MRGEGVPQQVEYELFIRNLKIRNTSWAIFCTRKFKLRHQKVSPTVIFYDAIIPLLNFPTVKPIIESTFHWNYPLVSPPADNGFRYPIEIQVFINIRLVGNEMNTWVFFLIRLLLPLDSFESFIDFVSFHNVRLYTHDVHHILYSLL